VSCHTLAEKRAQKQKEQHEGKTVVPDETLHLLPLYCCREITVAGLPHPFPVDIVTQEVAPAIQGLKNDLEIARINDSMEIKKL